MLQSASKVIITKLTDRISKKDVNQTCHTGGRVRHTGLAPSVTLLTEYMTCPQKDFTAKFWNI